MKDLETILFFKRGELKELIYRADSGEGDLCMSIAKKKRMILSITSLIALNDKISKLPGRILGVEVKELLIKGGLAILASCSSAILRLGLD